MNKIVEKKGGNLIKKEVFPHKDNHELSTFVYELFKEKAEKTKLIITDY